MPVDPEAGGPARAMHSVEGRVIIVTGSGQGVGRGMANHLGKAGASIVGGCCGTTPSYTRAMKSSLRALDAMEGGARTLKHRRRGCRCVHLHAAAGEIQRQRQR